VEPTATVIGQVNVLRDDEVRPSLPVEEALANAPDREGDGFHVPKIIEER
jgi:aspartyl-tRNA(Asn)/glutamyl-tRNA(Gln) amidotransferase subunit C